ncbi:MAG TPA: hypothetical protein VFG62_26010 [Rhodopila sp.]|jgi:hypothetical protein|nr:hypothetical protein [Rhodopila sp.]
MTPQSTPANLADLEAATRLLDIALSLGVAEDDPLVAEALERIERDRAMLAREGWVQ